MVSIIIPAYNVEKYIHRAITSSINQTYKDVEIIIINDGSTDNTYNTILSLSAMDSRIVVLNQKNAGVSNARNHGMSIAKGEFIIFLDSDDWLERDAVEKLVSLAKPGHLICCDRYFCYSQSDNGIKREAQNCKWKDDDVKKSDMITSYCSNRYNLQSSCYKLFETDILKKNNIVFNAKIYHGEDGLFVFEYLQHSEGIIYRNMHLWNILEREGSATTGSYNKKWLSALSAADTILNYREYSNEQLTLLKQYYAMRALYVKYAAIQSKEITRREKEIINDGIKKYYYEYMHSSKSIKSKMLMFAFRYFPFNVLRFIPMLINKK